MNVIIKALISLVSGIYYVVAKAFELFIILANGEFISSENYKLIIDNIYLILGIILLFVLSFSMLKAMVNPDDQKQGTSVVKKVIVNLITSTVILALLPTIFTFAYDFQNSIISEYNVIGKFFNYGSSNSSKDSSIDSSNIDKVKSGAYTIVNSVYTAFFNVNMDTFCLPESLTEEERNDILVSCQNKIDSDSDINFGSNYASYGAKVQNGPQSLYSTINFVGANGNFNLYSSFSSKVVEGDIDFNFFLSLICAGILLYVALSFCFDMAVRMVKLVFYQLIAPVPIFFRVMPNSKLSDTFNEWVKVTLACYLEIYIRIFIFYFSIFLCNEIISQDYFSTISQGYGIFLGLLAKAFVLMGLITFMKQAPSLISKVTGIDTSKMKLGIREKLAAGGAFTAGAVLGGGLTAGVRNATNAWQNTFKKGEDGKWHKREGVKKREMVWNAASIFSGAASGATRGAKSGWGAKSEKDMKNIAASSANAAINARDKRAAYIANHDNSILGATKGHVTDAIHSAKEWAGIGVTSSTEADYYTSGANAFDSAHTLIEGTYKNKPGHNKIKERTTELDSLSKRLNKQIEKMKNDDPNLLNRISELSRLENVIKSGGILTPEQSERLITLKTSTEQFRNLNEQYLETSKSLSEAKLEQSIHEAGEMSKKMSVSLEAINNLVNAKTRYFDISKDIFNDELYKELKDASDLGMDRSEVIKKLISKIENNQEIVMEDLRDKNTDADLVDLNSLEKFLDKAGIRAKDIAAKKRIEVAHAKALKDEKKGDKK